MLLSQSLFSKIRQGILKYQKNFAYNGIIDELEKLSETKSEKIKTSLVVSKSRMKKAIYNTANRIIKEFSSYKNDFSRNGL